MIGYIKGKVLSFADGKVLLENNGIGYEITCSSLAYANLLKDSEGEVYTYMNVTQEGVSLYGFSSLVEKDMFLMLITVSGVGAKMAVGILSGISLSDLTKAIMLGDVKTLSTVKGLGKKTAERIILELKEKISGEGMDLSSVGEAVAPVQMTSEDEDAVTALTSLGFGRTESLSAVKEAKKAGETNLQKIIAYALKHIK